MRQRLGLGGYCFCHLLLLVLAQTQETSVAPGTTTMEADQQDQTTELVMTGSEDSFPELEDKNQDGEDMDFQGTPELWLRDGDSTSLTVEWPATAGVAYLLTWLGKGASFNRTIGTTIPAEATSSSLMDMPLHYTIGNLTEGSMYKVCVGIQGTDSNSTCLSATTWPAAVEGVNLTEIGDSVKVIWNKPNHEDDQIIWRYIVEVMCEANHQVCGCEVCQDYRKETTLDLEWSFKVEPDTFYSVRVAAMTADSTLGPYSLPANLTTKPEVPLVPDVSVMPFNRLVILHWKYTCPYTGPARYDLSFHNKTFNYSTSDGCHYTARINDLTPYTEYNYSLLAKLEDSNMNCSSDEEGLSHCGSYYSNVIRTKPDVPSVPTSLEVRGPDFQSESPDSKIATVTWQPPEHANGLLRRYRLEYGEKGGDKTIFEISDTICSIRCNCSLLSCRIPLRPETEYEFQVQAENHRPTGLSKAALFDLTTTAGIPYFIGIPMKGNSNESTHSLQTTYPILIVPDAFGQDNGLIRKYELFVRKNSSRPTWDVSKDMRVFVGNDTSDKIPFVIGENRRPCTVTACNQPLTPDTEYYSFIRIHTSASYNDFSMSFKTEPSTDKRTILAALLVTAGLIFLVIVMARLYVQYFSIMRRSESMELPMVVTTPPDINVERRILLSDLSSHVFKLLSQRNQGLRREFLQLKSVSPEKPSRAANLPSNWPKNRYVNILPFDETRVRMKEYRSIPCSDYINASYIHGYSQSRRFIACQGPTDHYVEDFWRMVWEKSVRVIVMVTQCIEKNKIKCSKYWPDQRQLQLKHTRLKVQLLHETELQPEGYIIRRLRLSKGFISRSVMHFHFVSWPDMGCPKSPDDLIGFVQAVKKAVPQDSSHVVVHCSAGVGRTGTFIGLSNLMDEVDREVSVDVFHAVYRMRLHRINMVQTEVQYAFLYKCVLKYYMKSTGQSEASFLEKDTDQEASEGLPSRTPTPVHDEPVCDSEDTRPSGTITENGSPQGDHLNSQFTDDKHLQASREGQ